MIDTNQEEYFKVAIATSLVLFGFDGENLKILTYIRREEPFKDAVVLPSKYVLPTEGIEQNVKNLMDIHTGVDYAFTEQLKAFAKVFRNPIGRVVNVAYYALVKIDDDLLEKSTKRDAIWVDYNNIPELAFDHNEIIDYAKERLKRRVMRRPIGFFMLPKYFTIAQLQRLYELTLNKELDKRNFRKKIFNTDLIIETDFEDTSKRKNAKLYMFNEDKYEKQSIKGYDFLF